MDEHDLPAQARRVVRLRIAAAKGFAAPTHHLAGIAWTAPLRAVGRRDFASRSRVEALYSTLRHGGTNSGRKP